MNKHYYLINGKVMKGGEMPEITNPNNDSLIYGDTYIRRWLSSLQPCDISESEFYKIHDYLIENIPFKNSDISNPIDITDIVKEKDGKIYFKQPTEKQVESECEAVELNIKLTEYCHKCGDGCCTNYGTITEINGEELPCHNQDAETILKQVLEHLGYKVNIETVTDYS
jgi:hypothetical protein